MTVLCAGHITSNMYGNATCGNAGKIERDGKLYCGTHDPEKIAKRTAERHAKWDAEAKAQREREEARKLIVLKAALFDDIVASEQKDLAALGYRVVTIINTFKSIKSK